MNNKSGLPFAILFSTIGLAVLTFGVSIYFQQTELIENGIKTQGQVIDNVERRDSDGSTYAPVVEFVTNQKERVTFTSSLSSYPPEFEVGEVVGVIYQADSPRESAEIDSWLSLWFGPLICGILGGAFSAFGLGFLFSIIGRMMLINRLKSSGQHIQAKLLRVDTVPRGSSVSYRIVAEAQGPDGTIHQFLSDDLKFDPTNLVNSPEITVMVDSMDWRKYYVDLSSLPRPN